jgi:hypothetical protein
MPRTRVMCLFSSLPHAEPGRSIRYRLERETGDVLLVRARGAMALGSVFPKRTSCRVGETKSPSGLAHALCTGHALSRRGIEAGRR